MKISELIDILTEIGDKELDVRIADWNEDYRSPILLEKNGICIINGSLDGDYLCFGLFDR